MATIGLGIRCHPSEEEILAEPDPHKRSRRRFGEAPVGCSLAAKAANPLICNAWAHVDESTKRVLIELRWWKPPTHEERTETARAAARGAQEWLGGDGWTIRVRAARPVTANGKPLPPLKP
jgi:hypothetical protein